MKTKLYAYFFLPAIVYSIISVALPLFLSSMGYAEDKIGNLYFITIANSLIAVLRINIPLEHFKNKISEVSGNFWSLAPLGKILGTLAVGILMTYFGFVNTFMFT